MIKKPHIIIYILSAIFIYGCSASKAIKKADKLYSYGEYYAASVKYRKAYRRLHSDEKKLRAHVSFYRGECYHKLNQSIKAGNEYKKALRYNYGNDTLLLHYAQVLQKSGKYPQASGFYKKFLDAHKNDEIAKNGIFACDKIAEWEKEKQTYEVSQAKKLNSSKETFSPILLPKEYSTIIFSSSKKVKSREKQKNSSITGIPDNNFWISHLDKKGKWEKPEYIPGEINSTFDEGAASVSADGTTLYFTRCVTKSDSIKSSSRAEIFKSSRSGDEWSTPEKITVYKDSTVIFAHPAISPEGKYLYYVSDMKGGFGGKDIWRSEISNNAFGTPENLGQKINTSGDEMFPSFREDGKFYFSSNGQPGYGGLDIFEVTITENGDTIIKNMGKPINSNADDFGITFSGTEEEGYFSSNRKNKRGWDKLWHFQIPNPQIKVKGTVYDRYGDILPDATIKIVSDSGLNTKIKADKDGTYELEIDKKTRYVMLAKCKAYLNYSNKFSIPERDEDTTVTEDFYLTPLYRPVRIENIHFAFDSWKLLPESYEALNELDKLLIDNPHIVIEIGAHTDRKGTEEYNNNLSEKRAASVVEYLTEQGIEKERLKSHGYGKSQPTVIDNYMHERWPYLPVDTVLTPKYIETLPSSLRDTADMVNRRCEFKVLKTTYKLF